MAYELFLIRFDPAPAPKGILAELRRAARSVVPAGDPLCEVGQTGGGRFRVETRSSQATVTADGADFRIDAFEPHTVPLVYAIAKAGGMAVTNARGPSETIVTTRGQLKHLPAAIRRSKPAVCESAEELGPLLGLVPQDAKPKRRKADRGGQYEWSKKHGDRRLGRGDPEPYLPGLREDPKERYFYVQLKPGEGSLLLMKRFVQFIKEHKRTTKQGPPGGGGVGNSDWLIRVPTGEVLVPWGVTGYDSRPDSDHLIPANIEAWVALLREFARQTQRATGTIVGGKKFVLDDGRSSPLTACKSRRARDEEG